MEDEYIGGIDEAGRGPVLGDMVYSMTVIKKSHYVAFGKWWNCCTKNIKTISFFDFLKENKNLLNNQFDTNLFNEKYKDSKQLTEEQRSQLFTILENLKNNSDFFDFETISITAKEISLNMYKDTNKNLNQIARDATFKLIEHFENKLKINTIFVDALGPSDKYEFLLKNKYSNIDFKVRSKCDTLVSVTSATSICAKYTRDFGLKNFIFEEKEFLKNYDKGYPSDPKTKKWLEDNFNNVFGFPNIVRFSWSTAQKFFEKNNILFDSEKKLLDTLDLEKRKIKRLNSNFSNIGMSYNFDF